MKRFILAFAALFLASAAFAGHNAVVSALTRVAITGEASPEELGVIASGTRWRGMHVDPMTSMVAWHTVLDSSICWVGQEPFGWGDVDPMFQLLIENLTDQPVRLEIGGGTVDVVYSPYAGGVQLPAVAIAETARGTERYTFLPPQSRCYGLLTYKSAKSAREIGWQVRGYKLGHMGARGTWIEAGGIWLYSVPVFETGAYSTKPTKWRGQDYTRVQFRDYNF